MLDILLEISRGRGNNGKYIFISFIVEKPGLLLYLFY